MVDKLEDCLLCDGYKYDCKFYTPRYPICVDDMCITYALLEHELNQYQKEVKEWTKSLKQNLKSSNLK